MNTDPHTHEITAIALKSREPYTDRPTNPIVITYGDQEKRVCCWLPFFSQRLAYEMKKIVRQHDKASKNIPAQPKMRAACKAQEMNKLLLQVKIDRSYGPTGYRTATARPEWGTVALDGPEPEPIEEKPIKKMQLSTMLTDPMLAYRTFSKEVHH